MIDSIDGVEPRPSRRKRKILLGMSVFFLGILGVACWLGVGFLKKPSAPSSSVQRPPEAQERSGGVRPEVSGQKLFKKETRTTSVQEHSETLTEQGPGSRGRDLVLEEAPVQRQQGQMRQPGDQRDEELQEGLGSPQFRFSGAEGSGAGMRDGGQESVTPESLGGKVVSGVGGQQVSKTQAQGNPNARDQQKEFLRKDGKLQTLPGQRSVGKSASAEAGGLSVSENPSAASKNGGVGVQAPMSSAQKPSLVDQLGRVVVDRAGNLINRALEDKGAAPAPGAAGNTTGVPASGGASSINGQDQKTGKADTTSQDTTSNRNVGESQEARVPASSSDVDAVIETLVEQCVRDQTGFVKTRFSSEEEKDQYFLIKRKCYNRISSSLGK